MSFQLPIDRFFRSKSKGSTILPNTIMENDQNKMLKKRSLSLKKPRTPIKSPKVNAEDKNDRAVIDLCSEDEDLCSPLSSHVHKTPEMCNNTVESDDSQKTIIYSTNSKSPLTPHHIPQTARIRVRSPASLNNSPSKYFSPNKKRAVRKISPIKKKLIFPGNDKHTENDYDELHIAYKSACEGFDDKTVFFLTVVYKYLNNTSLKDLLSEESQDLLSQCMEVLKPGMRLVCRLYWFKKGWLKEQKIKSILAGKEDQEDDMLSHVLDSLVRNNFIVINNGVYTMTFEEMTNILGADELKQICKDFKLKFNSKQSAIEALKSFSKRKSIMTHFSSTPQYDNSSRVLNKLNQKTGTCYRLSDLAMITINRLYVLMFLGIDYSIIREKKLELLWLYDKIKRETYPVCDEDMIDDASVVFKDKSSFERYMKAHSIYESFLVESDLQSKCKIILDIYKVYKSYSEEELQSIESIQPWLRRYTNLNLYVKILDAGIHDLKRAENYRAALDILTDLISQNLFRQHKKADWYAEKSLVLQKRKHTKEAAHVLLEGLESDIPAGYKDMLRARAAAAAARLAADDACVRVSLLRHADEHCVLEKNIPGVHVHKQPMDRTQSKGKLKFESRTSEGRIVQDVEEFCISHYLESGEFTHGEHWEGRIVTTIFFLLFWDIIYSKPANCPGVFLTRFQKFPSDLFTDSFYTNRKEKIEKRLSEIGKMSNQKLLDTMQETWDGRPEGEQSGLSTGGVQWAALRQACACAGPRACAALCRRLAADYRAHHSGFPDLTLWNIHTMKIMFVEVKSDADKPSIKQIQWMQYLQRHGIDVQFCYVGVHTTRNKARAK